MLAPTDVMANGRKSASKLRVLIDRPIQSRHGALIKRAGPIVLSTAHQKRHSSVLQQRVCNAAEQPLPQARVPVGARNHKPSTELSRPVLNRVGDVAPLENLRGSDADADAMPRKMRREIRTGNRGG